MEGLSMQAILVLQRMCTADMRLTVRRCGDLCRLGVSEHTDSSTHVPFELKGCTPTISDVYLPVGRMTIQG